MKKIIFKITSLVLVTIMLTLVFAGCDKTTSGNTVSITYQSGKKQMIVDSSDKIDCDYLLVYHETSTYAEIDAYIDFLEQLSLNSTSSFQLCPDSLIVPKSNQKILLLGDTSYDESVASASVVSDIRKNNYYDYLLRGYGNRLTINWASKHGRDDAFKYILDTLLNKGFSSAFDDDYSYLYLSSRSDSPVVTINDVNLVQYSVVLPTAPSYLERYAAENLVEAIKEVTGVEVPLVTDDIDESTYEILIGDTNRGETYITSFFATQRFTIAQYSTKLILRGGHLEATATAVDLFTENIKKCKITAEPLHLKSGYYLTGNTDKYNTSFMGGYDLVYSDEFNLRELDTEIWTAHDLGIPTYGLAPSILTYDPENFEFNGEKLGLITHLGSSGYVTGNLSSHDKLSFKYGYLELRAKFRTAPSYWVKVMLTNQLDGEDNVSQIDVFNSMFNNEVVFASAGVLSNDDYYQHFLDLNKPNYECYRDTSLTNGATFNQDEYHTYGVEWTDKYLRFFLDGKPYGTVELTADKYKELQKELYIEFNASVEMFDQETDDEAAQWPASFDVDWIRLYQKKGVGSINFHDEPVTETPDKTEKPAK